MSIEGVLIAVAIGLGLVLVAMRLRKQREIKRVWAASVSRHRIEPTRSDPSEPNLLP